MKCPKCEGVLEKQMHMGIEVDQCDTCKGIWLELAELDQLEDEVFDEDELKGSLILRSVETEHKCPDCGRPLKRFHYRLNDLELEYCEEEHGFWLDEGEEKRILEIMKKRSKDMDRKFAAEASWGQTLRGLKSKSLIHKIKGLFK